MLHDEFTVVNLAEKTASSGRFTAVNFCPTRSEQELSDFVENRVFMLRVTQTAHHHQPAFEIAALDYPKEMPTG